MTSKWKIVLEKEIGTIVVGTFKTKRAAEQELEDRNRLTIHMGYSPEPIYKIIQEKTYTGS